MLDRRLAYKDRFVYQLEENVATSVQVDVAATFPDQTTPTTVTVQWTQEQYTRILSALLVGAELTYPYQSQQIAYDFLMLTNGGSMSCDDIADCIESSQAVLDAILQQLTANGFTQNNYTSAPSAPYLTPAQTAENLLPATYSCSDAQIMATAKALTIAFDRAVTDILDEIELLTDPAELLAILGDNVEFVSYLTTFGEVATWMQDTFASVYNASYDAIVEQNIACLIYCAAIVDCEITLDMLISVMVDGMGAIEPPPDPDDVQALFEWLIGIDTSVGEAVVCAFFWFVLQTMRFAASLLPDGFVVIADLKEIIAGSIGKTDNSYLNCDDCPPTETPNTYWLLEWDFTLGQQGTILQTGTPGVFGNSGYEGRGTPTRVGFQYPLGTTTVYLAGWDMTYMARGAIGNGTNDYGRLRTNPQNNYGGTWVSVDTNNFLNCNQNDCNTGETTTLFVDNNVPAQAIEVVVSVDGAYVSPTNVARIYKARLWGYNHGDYKPAGAVWVSSIP